MNSNISFLCEEAGTLKELFIRQRVERIDVVGQYARQHRCTELHVIHRVIFAQSGNHRGAMTPEIDRQGVDECRVMAVGG